MITNIAIETKHAVSEFVGFASHIIYDGDVSDNDVKFLQGWLSNHYAVRDQWPMVETIQIIKTIVADGVITEEERKHIYNYLKSFVLTETSSNTPDNIYAMGQKIDFVDRYFIFTGEMIFNERSDVVIAVKRRGGICPDSSNISKETDYLVVGSIGSPAWAGGRFGRKIEKALTYQKNKQSDILIILEDDFVSSLFDAPILHD